MGYENGKCQRCNGFLSPKDMKQEVDRHIDILECIRCLQLEIVRKDKELKDREEILNLAVELRQQFTMRDTGDSWIESIRGLAEGFEEWCLVSARLSDSLGTALLFGVFDDHPELREKAQAAMRESSQKWTELGNPITAYLDEIDRLRSHAEQDAKK